MTAGLLIVLCHCERSEAIHSARTALDCFVLRCKPRNDRRFVHRPLSLRAQRSNPFCKTCAGFFRLSLQASQPHRVCSSSSVIASVAKQSILQEPRWIASSCVASLAMTADLFIVLCHCGQSEAIHSARTALYCFVLRCKPRNDSGFVHRPLS